MPGYRGTDERTETIMLRVTHPMKERWRIYASHAGIATLIRHAVETYIKEHPDARRRALDGTL